MNNNNLYGFLNNPAFDTLQRIQREFNNSALFATMSELQKTLDMAKIPTPGITAVLKAYQDSVAPLMSTVQNINNLYSPILEQTKKYECIYNKSMVAVLQSSVAAINTMAGIDFSAIENIANSLPKYDFLSQSILRNIDFDGIAKLYENGEITYDDIAEEFGNMVTQKDFSFVESWDKVKKAKWFLALRCLLIILTFLGKTVMDKVTDNTLEDLGVNGFWAESGIYEWLDDVFGFEESNDVVTEQEAKETIQKENIGNVSKQKRDDLLSKIKEIRTYIASAPQDENTGNLLTYLSELEKDVNGKKYGLIFEQHREEIDEVLSTHTPVLCEDESLFIDNGGNMNFLIEGDNLASLKLLEKTHKGRIDLIYIDPPYNTGSKDFIYNDAFLDKNDCFSHSKWLSFMKERLQLASKLMSKRGAIFISIDDNEQSQLKILCDEIFGAENFVANLVWAAGRKNDSKYISISHEYMLCYVKSFEYLKNEKIVWKERKQGIDDIYKKYKKLKKEYSDDYKLMSDKLKDWYRSLPENHPARNHKHYNCIDEKGIYFPSDISWPGGGGPKYEVIHPVTKKPVRVPNRGWVYPTQDRMNEVIALGLVHFGEDETSAPCKKTYLSKNESSTPYSVFYKDGRSATKRLRTILGNTVFQNPKDEDILQEIINFSATPSSMILDFFAGSGTTGHAVMKLNAEDGGNRRFILCTNNENNICRDVTYERIKRVIDKENYTASLKYLEVEYVPISKRMYYEYADELLKHIRELVELENGVSFNYNAEIAIVLTDEELDDFVSSLGKDSKCCKLYMGHDLLPSVEQEAVIAAQGIEINIIPDYYYRDLQEG